MFNKDWNCFIHIDSNNKIKLENYEINEYIAPIDFEMNFYEFIDLVDLWEALDEIQKKKGLSFYGYFENGEIDFDTWNELIIKKEWLNEIMDTLSYYLDKEKFGDRLIQRLKIEGWY